MATEQRAALIVSSIAFEHGSAIPVQYSCEGAGINPPLHIENIPRGTQSLAIIAEDPDTAKGVFDHWIAWNIPVMNHIAENSVPGTSGINSSGKTGYHPPCPPDGSHRYFFYVFALDTELPLTAGAGKKDLQDAMKDHVLASGTLMGRYQKTKAASGT
jgi:Raf kinase inhibitor-like YbhB/YbcL family protein